MSSRSTRRSLVGVVLGIILMMSGGAAAYGADSSGSPPARSATSTASVAPARTNTGVLSSPSVCITPSVSILVVPTRVTVGQSAELLFTGGGPIGTTFTASGAWHGDKTGQSMAQVTPTTAGTYTYVLTARSPCGAHASSHATLTVKPVRTTTTTTSGTKESVTITAVCETGQSIVRVSVIPLPPNTGFYSFTVSGTGGGSYISFNTNDAVLVGSGAHTVTVTDSGTVIGKKTVTACGVTTTTTTAPSTTTTVRHSTTTTAAMSTTTTAAIPAGSGSSTPMSSADASANPSGTPSTADVTSSGTLGPKVVTDYVSSTSSNRGSLQLLALLAVIFGLTLLTFNGRRLVQQHRS